MTAKGAKTVKASKPAAKSKAVAKPTQQALQASGWQQDRRKHPERITLQSVEAVDGVLSISETREAHELLDTALGSSSGSFQALCLTQLTNVLRMGINGKQDFTLDLNAALAMLSAIDPKDELEAMLAVQMVATHCVTMQTTALVACAPNPKNREINANLATKFARTFATQMEALSRHRRGGKQIVEHVHVNDGGQAVFANNVTTGGGGAR